MKTGVVIVLCVMLSNISLAAGDATAGQSKAILCIGCHGVDGNNDNSLYPLLAGQGQAYLAKQLRDFKSGARKEEHMTSMVAAIDAADIDDIAAYFASQKLNKTAKDVTAKPRGKDIYQNGIQAKGVAACAGCHGDQGKGHQQLKFPQLAGQHRDYIGKMLKAFRSKQRSNDTQSIMRNIAVALSDADIDALAQYISAMQ